MYRFLKIAAAAALLVVSVNCFGMGKLMNSMSVETSEFGKTKDGEVVYLYTLSNSKGMKVQITNYGGIVTSLYAPDREGDFEDVVLGYDNLKDYIKDSPYFGAIVGRYANRIAKGKFELHGEKFKLAVNNGPNHLHGGITGFDKVVWLAKPFKSSDEAGLELTYVSRDGEEGYPGNLTAIVTYTLTNDNELKVDYYAYTDAPTVVNLSQHSYFNLDGQGTGDILDHRMMINADHFTPVDETLIPTGELRPVKGTPFDFTEPAAIGARIDNENTQLEYGMGYDHNWALNRKDDESLSLAAKVYEPDSGRVMEVLTTEPGLQFYSGNFLDGSLKGKDGRVYKHRYAFCLETQHFPDSPNKSEFPSVVLKPGEKYTHTTVFRFSAK